MNRIHSVALARTTTLTRYLGALAVLAVGVDHIEQYYVDYYRAVPTIGTLFALDFVAATVIAVGLMLPLRRLTRTVRRSPVHPAGARRHRHRCRDARRPAGQRERGPVRVHGGRLPQRDRAFDRLRRRRHRLSLGLPRAARPVARRAKAPPHPPQGTRTMTTRNFLSIASAAVALVVAGCGGASSSSTSSAGKAYGAPRRMLRQHRAVRLCMRSPIRSSARSSSMPRAARSTTS